MKNSIPYLPLAVAPKRFWTCAIAMTMLIVSFFLPRQHFMLVATGSVVFLYAMNWYWFIKKTGNPMMFSYVGWLDDIGIERSFFIFAFNLFFVPHALSFVACIAMMICDMHLDPQMTLQDMMSVVPTILLFYGMHLMISHCDFGLVQRV